MKSTLLFLGALFVALAVLTPHWLSTGGGSDGDSYSFHAGLIVLVNCEHDSCSTNAMFKGFMHGGNLGEKLGVLMGLATALCGLAASVLAVITGAATLKGQRGPATLTFIFFGIVAMGSIAFMVLLHLFSPSMWGYSLLLLVLGLGLGISGSILAMQIAAVRPIINYGMMPPMGMQPGFMAPPPGSVPSTPPCNQCGGQTQFVQQYGKLFCGRCNRYIV